MHVYWRETMAAYPWYVFCFSGILCITRCQNMWFTFKFNEFYLHRHSYLYNSHRHRHRYRRHRHCRRYFDGQWRGFDTFFLFLNLLCKRRFIELNSVCAVLLYTIFQIHNNISLVRFIYYIYVKLVYLISHQMETYDVISRRSQKVFSKRFVVIIAIVIWYHRINRQLSFWFDKKKWDFFELQIGDEWMIDLLCRFLLTFFTHSFIFLWFFLWVAATFNGFCFLKAVFFFFFCLF